MFQLIISILAIILAVALAGVSIYYGGSAFSNGSEKAQYATLTNQGAQIEAAMTLYRAQEGAEASALTDLVTNEYLKQIPTNEFGAWAISGDHVVVEGVGEAVCAVDDANAELVANTDANVAALVAAQASGVSGCLKTDATSTVASAKVFYYAL